MPAPRRVRMRAQDRREQVLSAAIEEFAEHGYHAGRTAEIARRAGISQPYVYALYPNKRELFLECSRRVFGRIGDAYVRLLANRTELRFQLQAYAATADPEIRARVRDGYMTMFDEVVRLSGQPRDAAARFFATGMLLNVAAALELPEDFL